MKRLSSRTRSAIQLALIVALSAAFFGSSVAQRETAQDTSLPSESALETWQNFFGQEKCVSEAFAQKPSDRSKGTAFLIFAGHVYGKPSRGAEAGLDENFAAFLHSIDEDLDVEIFLLGDLLENPSDRTFATLKNQLAGLPFEFYLAPGNHDQYDLFANKYTSLGIQEPGVYRTGRFEIAALDSTSLQRSEEVLSGISWSAATTVLLSHHIPNSSGLVGHNSINRDVRDELLLSRPEISLHDDKVVRVFGDVGLSPTKPLSCRTSNREFLIATGLGGTAQDHVIVAGGNLTVGRICLTETSWRSCLRERIP